MLHGNSLIAVVLVGATAVGKTQLLARFTRDAFNLEARSTVGVAFATKTIEVDDQVVTAQIWDTGTCAHVARTRQLNSLNSWPRALQSDCASVSPPYFIRAVSKRFQRYYRGAVGVLLVYDIACRSTFDDLPRWLDEIRHHVVDGVTILLVGNKSDLHHIRSVEVDEAAAFAEANDLVLVETSALEATGVNEAFGTLLKGE